MALYLPRHNALLVIPPQTVGADVRRTLARHNVAFERVGHPHATLAHLAEFRAEHRPFTAAFVSHPLTWYASYWRHARKRDPRWGSASSPPADELAWPLDPALGSEDFATFIDQVSRRAGVLLDLYRQYTGKGTDQKVDFIAKRERLPGQLSQLFDRIGITPRPRVLEKLPRRPRHRQLYTPELAAMVTHAESGLFAAYRYRRPKVDHKVLARRKANVPLRPGDIPGWLSDLDREMFRFILVNQVQREPLGDLVELGAYLGKSAVIIGESQREGEAFVVCDLFGEAVADVENLTENQQTYSRSLTRERFERNYLQFHEHLPEIHQMATSQIVEHVSPGSVRFVHVDASHLYEHVVVDIASARAMLRPGGVVVFDDYRSGHTPGVAAAVWGEMATGGLRPIVLTPHKWYGTWDDPLPLQRELAAWLRSDARFGVQVQRIAGMDVLRAFVRLDKVVDYEDELPAALRPSGS